jgi:hypothetical protein
VRIEGAMNTTCYLVFTAANNAANTNTTLWAAVIGAGAAMICVILFSIVYYLIEKQKSESETKKFLRDDRKRIYMRLFAEIDKFKKDHLDEFVSPETDPNGYESWLYDAVRALDDTIMIFVPELELIGNLELAKLLRQVNRSIDHSRSHQTFVGEEGFAPDDDLIPQTEVDETKNKLGRVMRLMRTELIPITETTRQEANHYREFWWESS